MRRIDIYTHCTLAPYERKPNKINHLSKSAMLHSMGCTLCTLWAKGAIKECNCTLSKNPLFSSTYFIGCNSPGVYIRVSGKEGFDD